VGKLFRAALGFSLIWAATSAGACGDKLSAFAHGARHGYPVHPAQIVVFTPPGSTAAVFANDPQFQSAVKKGGHKVRLADSAQELTSYLASGNVDLVLADMDSMSQIEERMKPPSTSALFVPIVNAKSKADLRSMEHRYPIVLLSHAKASHYLDALDDAAELHTQRGQLVKMARK
jgi:hypothetical protein